MIIERSDDTKMNLSSIPEELLPLAQEAQNFLEVRNIYQAAIKEVSTKLEILDDEFQVNHDYNPIHHMESRVKSVNSMLEKIIRRGLSDEEGAFSKITDLAGIRVICKYTDDIYRISEMLLKQHDIELVTKMDYIKNPKESGYRSLHLIVKVPVFLSDRVEHVPVEIQVRSVVMDTWASLEHELRYKKNGKPLSQESSKILKQMADQLEEIDDTMSKIHREASRQ